MTNDRIFNPIVYKEINHNKDFKLYESPTGYRYKLEQLKPGDIVFTWLDCEYRIVREIFGFRFVL